MHGLHNPLQRANLLEREKTYVALVLLALPHLPRLPSSLHLSRDPQYLPSLRSRPVPPPRLSSITSVHSAVPKQSLSILNFPLKATPLVCSRGYVEQRSIQLLLLRMKCPDVGRASRRRMSRNSRRMIGSSPLSLSILCGVCSQGIVSEKKTL